MRFFLDRGGIGCEEMPWHETLDVRQGVPGGVLRIVHESCKPIPRVARDLGVPEGTLGDWLNLDARP